MRRWATVVLLHGFPQHWYVWRHVLPRLAATHRVLALDLRGCGWSEAPKHGYSTGNLAEDVIAVLDALGIDHAAIVGHDWGGWVGFVAALTASGAHQGPGLGEHDASVAGAPAGAAEPVADVAHGVHRAPADRAAGAAAHRVRRRSCCGIGRPTRHCGSARILRIYTDLLRDPGRARAVEQANAAYVWREILGHPLGRYRKARLRVPTLIIGGERDVVIPPAVLEGGERHADELKVVVLPGGGHLLPEEQPAAVAEVLLGFLG